MPTMPSHVLRRLATAIVVALTLLGALDARAETICSDTILTTSTPNTSNQDEVRVSSDLNNCRASEGCLGKSSLFVVGSFPAMLATSSIPASTTRTRPTTPTRSSRTT